MNLPVLCHRWLAATAALLAAAFACSAAHANALYTFLVIDPVTTAGAGVDTSSGFSVSSNRSGAGTWHLYAVDDLDSGFGIRSFNVKLIPGEGGSIGTLCNRTPNTLYATDPALGEDSSTSYGGFNDIRGIYGTAISGGQSPINTAQIGGLGITAGNFAGQTPGRSFSPTTSGQWGNYADPFTSGYLGNTGEYRNALFLGEGTYTGGAPTVDLTTSMADGGTGINYWTNSDLTRSATAPLLSSSNPFACPDCVNIHDPFLVSAKIYNPPVPPPVIELPTAPTPPTTTPVDDPTPPPATNEGPQETQPPVSPVDPPIGIGEWTVIEDPTNQDGVYNQFIYYLADPTDLTDATFVSILPYEFYSHPWILQSAMVTNFAEMSSQTIFGTVGEDIQVDASWMPMAKANGVDHDGLDVARFAFAQPTGADFFDSQAKQEAVPTPEPAGLFLMLAAQGCLLLLARCRRR